MIFKDVKLHVDATGIPVESFADSHFLRSFAFIAVRVALPTLMPVKHIDM
jgi:hypothetical protein